MMATRLEQQASDADRLVQLPNLDHSFESNTADNWRRVASTHSLQVQRGWRANAPDYLR